MRAVAFMIDKDHTVDDRGDGYRPGSALNANGYVEGTDADAVKLRAGEGMRVRLYDDDQDLYYEGRQLARGDAEHGGAMEWEDYDFEPLTWAMANAGCTYLMYEDEHGDWKYL